MENSKTRAWTLYEQGRNYNNRLRPNQYRVVEQNWEFFTGNQWPFDAIEEALRTAVNDAPTFNILKRVASLFIASLTSSGVTIRFEPLAFYGLPLRRNPSMGGPGAMGGNPPQGPADFGGGGGFAVGGDAAAAEGGVYRNLFSGGSGGFAPFSGGSAESGNEPDVADIANAEVENLLEKFGFDYLRREALFDGAVTGDYCAHFWFDPTARPYGGALGEERGEIRMELVDGINVMFGNPNDRSVENQPWILLVGRDTVERLREEARRFRRNRAILRGDSADPEDGSGIQSDAETQDFPGIGGQTEMEEDGQNGGKALYVLLYSREGDTIHVTKATRSAVIYEDVDTGLSVYPIAWGNWEKQKNQYHGRALVTGLIPNQIFINKMFVVAMQHMQTLAFPKVVYDARLIPFFPTRPGEAVAVKPGNEHMPISVNQLATVLPAADMSGQISSFIDKVMTYTRECLGATDAQMGNVRPDNTSALMVLQTNAEVPLENIRANLHEWVESIGRILLDMMGTYYGRRQVVVDQDFPELVPDSAGLPRLNPADGTLESRNVTRKVVRTFDFSVFKDLWLTLRVDVGATTYFSEIAMTQTLDNLRRDGTLNVIQYLDRIPDKLIPKKEELIRELRDRELDAASGQSGSAAQQPIQAGPLDEAAAVQGLPNHMAAAYQNLGAVQKRTARELGARSLRAGA